MIASHFGEVNKMVAALSSHFPGVGKMVVLAAAAMSLSGCQTISAGGCPALVEYSVVEQREAAREVKAHPHGQLAKMIGHYLQMRDACRVVLPHRPRR